MKIVIRTTKKGDDWFHFGRACLRADRAVITLAAFGYPRRNAQGERGLPESDVPSRCVADAFVHAGLLVKKEGWYLIPDWETFHGFKEALFDLANQKDRKRKVSCIIPIDKKRATA